MATLFLGAGFLSPTGLQPRASLVGEREHAEQLQRQVARLAHETLRLEAGFKDPDPEEIYLVVDTQANRLSLHQGRRLLRTAWVSTGSGETLRDPRRGRTWVFETPRGVRRVRAKLRNPVWLKPDWAFLQEGLPVPPPRDPSRVVRDFLGEYALDLGHQITMAPLR
jgi:L,D-transpeptidase YbiS